MRVVAITNMYPPHHYGGYELVCRRVTDELRARGHDVTLVTSTVRVAGVEEADPPGADVRRSLTAYWHDHVLLRPPLRERLAIERRNQAALAAVLDEVRPDVVTVWHMGALSFGLLSAVERRGIPLVYVIADDWLVYGPDLDPWLRPLARRPRLGRLVEAVTGVPSRLPRLDGAFLFASEHTRRAAEQGRPGLQGRRAVVPWGVDLRDFPLAPPADRPWSDRLLVVGRIDPRKGIDVAIDALARLPDATLNVVGRGDDAHRADLVALADRLGVGGRVRWSVAERSELAAVYAAADVLLFPVRWDEPFGMVPLEAMACATPVVATGTGGSAEFLRHESSCLLVPPGDAGALADAVDRLRADAALRARLVAGGLATAAELSLDRLTDRVERWLEASASGFAHGEPSG